MPSLVRRTAFVVLFSVSLCLLAARVSSQGVGVRRVTHTPPGTINLNPTISGDGLRLAFETSADLGAAGTGKGLRLVSADAAQAPTFKELALSRAPAPALSQDGARAAFASNADPLGENRDGDSEIFLFDGVTLPIPLPRRHAYASNIKRQRYASSKVTKSFELNLGKSQARGWRVRSSI